MAVIDQQTGREIRRLLEAGYGPTSIARSLNARGVSTPTGVGVWWPSSVQRAADPQAWAAYMRGYRQRGR